MGTLLHLGGVHELLPVSFPDGGVLQLVDGSQGGQQVLHSRLQTRVYVPHAHLLIQHLHFLQKQQRHPQFGRNSHRDEQTVGEMVNVSKKELSVLWRIV